MLRAALYVGLASSAAALAAGQPARHPGKPGGLEPAWRVEQGVADVSPLGVSRREMMVDLRAPLGFESVYRLPGGQFARASGGVTAVFQQSIYADTREGIMAEIPPGTVFFLGDPPGVAPATPLLSPLARERAALTPVDLSAHQLWRAEPGQERSTLSPVTIGDEPPSIWTSEEYRRRRVAQLLGRALEAHAARGAAAR